MSKKRKFRKLALKTEVVAIEAEEVEEQDSQYSIEFNKDFRLEMAFLSDKKSKDAEEDEGEDKPLEVSNEFLKKLHRELARILHPDLNPNSDDDDFKKMQSAYEQGDGATLIAMAVKYDIEFDLDDESLQIIEEQIEEKQKNLEDKKETCRWVWGSSDKNDNLRSRIIETMGIDQDEFSEWLEKNKLNDINKK